MEPTTSRKKVHVEEIEDDSSAQGSPILTTPRSILLGALIISLAILTSGGIISANDGKLRFALQGAPATRGTTGAQAVAPDASAPAEALGPLKASIGDAPIIGDKNAQLTVIEFSDYECPFCKRHFEETWPELMTNYINNGKVKLAFKNLPLSFHQNAHGQAQAALCAREQGGDSVYYKYHDEIFKRTTSGGTGLALDKLDDIATEIGLNGAQLQSCLDAEKYKQKVDDDMAAAQELGATGTPSFIIGKSTGEGVIEAARQEPDPQYPQNLYKLYDSNDNVIGVKMIGALPYANFKTALDSLQ